MKRKPLSKAELRELSGIETAISQTSARLLELTRRKRMILECKTLVRVK